MADAWQLAQAVDVMFFNARFGSLKNSLLLTSLLMLGCTKSEPIKLTESLNEYIGIWQFLYESHTKTRLDITNVLLVINADSTAVYRQCIISKTVSEDSSSTSSVDNVSMLNPEIVGITSSTITLEQEAEFPLIGSLFFNYDLAITKTPYLESGRWYMEIDKTRLKKLEGNEASAQTSWDCPTMDLTGTAFTPDVWWT